MTPRRSEPPRRYRIGDRSSDLDSERARHNDSPRVSWAVGRGRGRPAASPKAGLDVKSATTSRLLVRRTGALLPLALAACFTLTAGAEAPPWGGLLVVDRAWPSEGHTGAVVTASFAGSGVSPVSYLDAFAELSGVAWGPGKAVYVGDGPRLRKIDAYALPTAQPTVIRNAYFQDIVDLERGPDGEIYLLDRTSDPLGEGYSGAVLRFDPETRSVSLIASHGLFGAPLELAVGSGGDLFVLDPEGRMESGGPATGAVFRVDPGTHAVEPLLSLAFAARPMAIALRDSSSLLLVDAQADVAGRVSQGGALFTISLGSLAVTDTIAPEVFREPVDVVLLSAAEIAVLDSETNPEGYSGGMGAVLRVDLESGAAVDTIAHPQFTQLAAIALYDGPDLDGSRFLIEGETRWEASPGARLRFTAGLVNRADAATGALEVSVEFGDLLCLFATAEVEAGTLSFDAGEGLLGWQLAIGADDSLEMGVDVRVPEDLAVGTVVPIAVKVSGEGLVLADTAEVEVVSAVVPGDVLYVDAGTTSPSPRVFYLGPGAYEPREYVADRTLMPRMTDLAFGPDGTLYILDAEATRPKVVSVDPRDLAKRVVYEGAPLVLPTAICLAGDGTLLITDPKDYYPGTTPPVIYRLDPQSGELTEFYTTPNPSRLSDPLDICPDREGHYLVADYVSSPGDDRWGRLVELDENGRFAASFQTAGLMDDPASVLVDGDGSIFLTDSTATRPSVIRLVRQTGGYFSFNRIAAPPEDTLLKAPVGIERLPSGDLVVCDWASNPYYANHGGLLRLSGTGINWDVAIQSFHFNLGRPRRAACFQVPEIRCDQLRLSDPSGEPLEPGDTLWVEAEVYNRSPMPGLGAGAVLSYPDLVEPVAWEASEGLLRVDAAGTVHWAVDLAFLRPETLRVGLKVDSLAPTEEVLEVGLQLLGGIDPPALAASDTIIGPLPPNQMVLLDAAADPFDRGHQGALFLIDTEELDLLAYRSHARITLASDVVMLDDHRALLLESVADEHQFGPDTGALWIWDLEVERFTLVAGGWPFVSPQRVLVLPDGDYLVLDAQVTGGGSQHGGLFRVPAAGGEPQLLATPPPLRLPMDMVLGGDGRLWIADIRANPKNFGIQNAGAIFAFDPETWAVVDTVADEDMHDPQGLLWVEDRGLYFTDPLYRIGASRGIRHVDPETGEIGLFTTSALLNTPTRMMMSAANEFLVVDSLATPVSGDLVGAVFRVSLTTGGVLGFLQDPAVVRPQALGRVPIPEVRIRTWQERDDAAGWWRESGDTLHYEIVADNPSRLADPLVSLQVLLPANLQLLEASLRASKGGVAAAAPGIDWQGGLAGGDSVAIAYSTLIRPRLPGMTPWIEQQASLKATLAVGDSASLRHYISSATGDGEVLLADAKVNLWADPRARGAVFRVEGPTREPVPVIISEILREPADVELLPGSYTDLVLLDADADPLGRGVTGCLLRASTQTGEVSLLYQDSTMIEPRALALMDSTTCYILDRRADPFDLVGGVNTGPGAVYRVNLSTGVGEAVASDVRFVDPADLVADPTHGRLFLIDRSAEGTGDGLGGVFVIVPSLGSVLPFWLGDPFLSPRCGAIGPEGDLLVLDRRQLGGAVLRVPGSTTPEVVGTCVYAEDPRDMVIDFADRMVFSDATANPGGFTTPTGSILRIDSEQGTCQLYRGGPPFQQPRGMAVRYEVTAVYLVSVRLAETSEGVRICWEAPQALGLADFYVYRREPEVPGSAYELLNAEDPIRGDGELCFLDPGAAPGMLCEYQLLALLEDGSRSFPPVSLRVSGRPSTFFLEPPVPNPFPLQAGMTAMAIRFGIPAATASVRLTVLDVSGRVVRTLLDSPGRQGLHTAYWDGRDGNGGPAASGVYFVRLEAGARRAAREILLIR